MLIELDVSHFNLVISVLGGFVLLFGLFSYVIKERLYLSEALVALIVGIAFGPRGAGLITPDDWVGETEAVTLAFARLVLGVQLVLAGVQLPSKYLQRQWKSLFMLLIPIMSGMWIISSTIVYLLVPGLSYLQALCIGACVTPTDPVLSNSIVKGKFAENYVPPHLRNIIVGESGANDGFGYPFLFIAIYSMNVDITRVKPSSTSFCLYGALVGWLAKELLHVAEAKKWIDKESFLVFSLALALFILGTCGMLGSDDLLSCFVAGNTFTWDDWFRKETEDESLQSSVDMLLNISIFVYIGAILPWDLFVAPVQLWRYLVLSALILIFRRLPLIMAFRRFIPAIMTNREGLFAGHFGPIGVGAIFYAGIALEQFTESWAREILAPVVYFIVLSSVLIHGITVPVIKLGSRIEFSTIDFRNFTISRASTFQVSSTNIAARVESDTTLAARVRQSDIESQIRKPLTVQIQDPRPYSGGTLEQAPSASQLPHTSPPENPPEAPSVQPRNRNLGNLRAYKEGDQTIIEDHDGGHAKVYDA
ncbi:putative Na(+)/H(+) antiporter [Neolecta irregularis DAH-3]|uniref:Putative Na(+)/H(+) antiporter n=1 Tax=Neolecta irregularis (strain DAH-3) TaxID=1198029 RepID=A0A1U7LM71_NEOID|nr:putative Na(+)/H(+) antiporter [Neolecta irregularis DAH-3]|eukprot:OLL23683.1 putative Na(+)/H(+) antiporter [Neolecta irregularis DAH-3]